LAIVSLHSITGECTPACLFAASNSVEAVTPPWNAGQDAQIVKEHQPT
jgi:hypothetical protein